MSSWWARLAGLVVVAQLLGQAAWLAQDRSPLGYEVPEHWLAAEEIAADLRDTWHEGGSLLAWVGRHRQLGHRATAVHLYAAAWLAPAPGAWWPLALATWTLGAASLVGLAWAAYRLARALAGPEAGALAAVAVTLAPPVWGFGRTLGVDLPLTACALLVARSLVESPPWQQPSTAFRLGLACGVGCLAKAQLVLWLPGLVIPALLVARAAGAPPRLLAASAIAWGLGLALGSAFFWAGALGDIVADARWSVAGPHTEIPGWSHAALAYYPSGLWEWCGPALGPLLALGLASCACTAAHRRRGLPPATWILAIGCVYGLALWTAYPIKWVRYGLPLIPLGAVLAALGLVRLPAPARRVAAGAAFAVASAIELMASTGLRLPLPAPEPAVLCHAPETRDWRPGLAALTRELGEVSPGAAIGLVGPADWPPDLYTLLEAHLRPHVPASATVYRRSELRDPDDLVGFERAEDSLSIAIYAVHWGAPAPSTAGGDLVGPFAVHDIDVPDARLALYGWRRRTD